MLFAIWAFIMLNVITLAAIFVGLVVLIVVKCLLPKNDCPSKK